MVISYLAREAVRASIRLYNTGPKFWGQRGYKQGYRQSIDHIIWLGGAAAESLKYNTNVPEEDGQIPQEPQTSKFSKARRRQQCKPGRRYPARHYCNGRSTKSRSHYSKSSRYRR